MFFNLKGFDLISIFSQFQVVITQRQSRQSIALDVGDGLSLRG